MLIDFNSIAKACWEKQYDTNKPPCFDDIDTLTSDNIDSLIHYIDNIETNNSYFELRQNLVEAIKTLLVISHIKQINLNDFFKISLNLSND